MSLNGACAFVCYRLAIRAPEVGAFCCFAARTSRMSVSLRESGSLFCLTNKLAIVDVQPGLAEFLGLRQFQLKGRRVLDR